MQVRLAHTEEFNALGQVMFDAIHAQPSPYTDAQRRAWNETPHAGADWHTKLARQYVVVAMDHADLVGFMTLEGDYVDFAYLLPHARGTGAFRKLYNVIEAQAGQSKLRVHASLKAEDAFAAMGFHVTSRETIARKGQDLRRAEMQKHLEQP